MDKVYYNIWSGVNPNDPNDYDFMALNQTITDDPSDYFLSSQTDLESLGTLEITGDIQYLPDYFSIK